jgi:hypothetical protein
MYTKTMNRVNNLENHPILWKLLKKYISHREKSNINLSKEYIKDYVNQIIDSKMYGKLFDVLLIEHKIEAPIENGYEMYDIDNLDLYISPLSNQLISLFQLTSDDIRTNKSIQYFISVLKCMFWHVEGEWIVDVLLIEVANNKKIFPRAARIFFKEYLKIRYEGIESNYSEKEIHNIILIQYFILKRKNELSEVFEIQINENDNKLILPKISREFIGEHVKRKFEEELEGIKEDFEKLIIGEYLYLKEHEQLHEVFEFYDFAEFKKIDDEWIEYWRRKNNGEDPPEPSQG